MSGGSFPHKVIRASAGSGKTHQLTNRFLGLLAAGVEPESILATTFTRKAAGEILDRVLWRLAEAASDANAATSLAAQIGGDHLTQTDFVRLLRATLRNLHRVRISTLDSFYIKLAGSFSLELGLPAGWSICEPADDAALHKEAVARLLEREQADVLVTLYDRLTRGETKRSVDGELLAIVGTLYDLMRETAADVWQRVAAGQGLSAAEIEAALVQLEAFDLSSKASMRKARDADIERAVARDWLKFLDTGIAAKVATGKSDFSSKPIPDELAARYGKLIEHARAEALRPIAEQTQATRDFLDRFHDELWALKATSGALRFGEVTQALVDALARRTLPDDALAFRLDGAVEHLLLDEFQDTSLAQWRVLHPIARRIVQARTTSPHSFFCVGDVKQAIYAWRGGMTQIFTKLDAFLGKLDEEPLDVSRRSAPPIIDAVNTVFHGAARFDAGDKCREGIAAWCGRFQLHTTTKTGVPGYVCLRTGPALAEGEGVAEQRDRHVVHVAECIRDLCAAAPGRSVGVLCRKNGTIARLIYELRRLGVDASEEGGNPLTDSPAVEVILSLFTLADHPGHSIARFHVTNTAALEEALRPFPESDALAEHLRRDLLAGGYGKFTQTWAQRLAPMCNRRDLSRLQQLIETAYDYQARGTLRADDFVNWVRELKVPDPSSAAVRVMTIHAAKGLQFDAVVLPELDCELLDRMKTKFVVDRDPDTLDVTFVCRYAKELVQNLLPAEQRRAFALDRKQRVEESLSTLYVAMTRAVHGLYLFIPGPRSGLADAKTAWYNLIKQTLAPEAAWEENALLHEVGTPRWFAELRASSIPFAPPAPPARAIEFRTSDPLRRRGLEMSAPSKREGGGHVAASHLFRPSEGTGMAAGTLFHAWFEAIAWLDDGPPTEQALRDVAQRKRTELPAETWASLDRLLGQFQAWLENPDIRGVLCRSAYGDPKRSAFPRALIPCWSKSLKPQQLERERRFLVRDGTTFWNGSFDRVVWLGEGDRTVAADVVDFKTDALKLGNAQALTERTDHYRPQIEVYKNAISLLSGLPKERIAARLVFTIAGRVVEL